MCKFLKVVLSHPSDLRHTKKGKSATKKTTLSRLSDDDEDKEEEEEDKEEEDVFVVGLRKRSATKKVSLL